MREYIAAPSTRAHLHAYARHRGLGDAAEDVAQTVLCDALAVQAVPVEDQDLPRWLNGIARHKICDEQRRRARWGGEEPPEGAVAPNREAEDLLRRIRAELVDPGERQALDWLVREHAGETLVEMARAEALAPQTLRQRLARFRRKLRARYLAPAAVLLALGVSGVYWTGPVSAPGAALGSSAAAAFAGSWRVVDVAPARYRSLDLRVVIAPDGGARVLAADGVVERKLSLEQLTAESVVVRSGDRSWRCRIEQLDADHFKLSSASGYVVLARQR